MRQFIFWKQIPSFILISFVFTVSACSLRMNRHMDYKIPRIIEKSHEVGARLSGTFVKVNEKDTDFGKPYRLLIWVKTKTSDKRQIIYKEVRLVNAENNESVFFNNEYTEERKEYDENISTYFTAKNLDIPYVKYNLYFKVIFQLGDDVEEKNFSLVFEKDYREFKSTAVGDYLKN